MENLYGQWALNLIADEVTTGSTLPLCASKAGYRSDEILGANRRQAYTHLP
jgi:hypothetical protein